MQVQAPMHTEVEVAEGGAAGGAGQAGGTLEVQVTSHLHRRSYLADGAAGAVLDCPGLLGVFPRHQDSLHFWRVTSSFDRQTTSASAFSLAQLIFFHCVSL